MAASTIGKHVTIEELRERYVLKEVPGNTEVHYRVGTGERTGRTRPGVIKKSANKCTPHYALGHKCADGKWRSFLEHVVVFALRQGRFPTLELDHKGQDRANNTEANLREATQSQNMANKANYRNNTSGYKGVAILKIKKRGVEYYRVRARVQCQTTGKRYSKEFQLGQEAEAGAWCAAKALEVHGEFARA